jgi:hypothetical protein
MNSKLILAPALLLAGGLANATNLFDPSVSSTSILDGSSLELDGTLHDTNGNPAPWVAELYAGRGECVRFFVTTTAFDAKITVIAPNGTVYRDDDSGGSLRPLVKIASAPVQGWYTVQVAHYAGVPQNANFTLLYGRYTAGNVNCANPTSPFGRTRPDEAQKDPSLAAEPAAKDPDAP